MAQQQPEWELLRSPGFSKGLNTVDAPELLDPSELTEAKNVQFLGGYLRSVPGYKTFAGVVRGSIQIIARVIFKDETEETLLLTTLTFYKLVGTAWQYMSDGGSTTVNATEASGQTVITVADSSDFTAADFVGIILDDATQHQTTIASVDDATTITIDDALPSQTTAGKLFVKAAVLTGTLDTPADYCHVVDEEKVIFVNGIQEVMVYDRTTIEIATDATNNAAATDLLDGTAVLARTCAVWNQRVFLGFTTEGGASYPQRLRYCAIGDVADWTGSDAGEVTLWDREDVIQSIRPFGGFLLIYRDWMFTQGIYVGQTSLLAVFRPMLDNEGVFSAKVGVDVGDRVIFLGRRDIYEYRGQPTLRSIGRNVHRALMSTSGVLDPTKHNRSFAYHNEESGDILFFLPTTNNNNPKVAYRFSLETEAWFIREFANNFTCVGGYIQSTQLTWDQAPGNWEEYDQDWSAREFNTNSKTILLGGSDSQVYEMDFIAVDDAGTDIPFSFATKDSFYPGKEIRVEKIEFLYSGPALTVEYSPNGGHDWEPYGTVSAQAQRKLATARKDVQAERIRFRFSAAANAFTFGYLLTTAQPAQLHT